MRAVALPADEEAAERALDRLRAGAQASRGVAVRMLLAPAVLTWLGDRAWWLPRWLDPALPHVDLDGGDRPAPAQRRPARLEPAAEGQSL